MTIRHTGCKLHPVWRVVICGDESFESSWIVSIWQHRQPPFTDTCGIFSKSLTNWLPVCVSKCLANRHPVWRVVRFESIRQHLQPPIADTCGIFSKSLTNWLPVCVSMFWEMVSQNSGITTPLSRESISGLTIRSGLGVLDNPPQLINDLEIFTLLLWACSFCFCQSLKL